MHIKQLRLLLGVGPCLATASPAYAEDARQRLPAIECHSSIEAPPEADRLGLMMPERHDFGSKFRSRGRTLPFNIGDGGLTFEVARLSSKLRPTIPGSWDRVSLKQLHFTGHVPIGHDSEILLTGDGAYMVRHLLVVPASSSRSRTYAARLGAGLGGRNWSIVAYYETIGARAREPRMHRMAELLGGAPENREGALLDVSSHLELSPRNKLDYRLTGRLARRTGEDLGIIGASDQGRRELVTSASMVLSF